MSLFSQSYTAKELTLPLVSLSKAWSGTNIMQEAFNKHRGFNKERTPRKSLAFCNVDVMLIGKYFPNVTFFNFKNEDIDMLRLRKGLLHGCFPILAHPRC